MNKSSASVSSHHNNDLRSSSTRSKSSQRHFQNQIQKDDIPYMSKKVTISQEKLLAKTKKVYNRSGADNKCEAKSLHLLCRAVNAQFSLSNNSTASNNLYTLQSKVEERFNPSSEAWKHAFILVISFLKKHQMELSLATVIVETPKEIEVRNYNGIVKVPFPISMKHFSSSENVSRVFDDLMRTKNAINNKTFTDKLNEFIEDMEMEDFWQRNPLLVFPGRFINTLSTVQTERSSAVPELPSTSVNNKSAISQNKADEDTDNNTDKTESMKDKTYSDNNSSKKLSDNLESSSTKRGTKKKKKGKKKKG